MDVNSLMSEIAKALEIETNRIRPETTSEMLDEWDSLGQISILARLDLVFDGITDRAPDLASATSVAQILKILSDHGL